MAAAWQGVAAAVGAASGVASLAWHLLDRFLSTRLYVEGFEGLVVTSAQLDALVGWIRQKISQLPVTVVEASGGARSSETQYVLCLARIGVRDRLRRFSANEVRASIGIGEVAKTRTLWFQDLDTTTDIVGIEERLLLFTLARLDDGLLIIVPIPRLYISSILSTLQETSALKVIPLGHYEYEKVTVACLKVPYSSLSGQLRDLAEKVVPEIPELSQQQANQVYYKEVVCGDAPLLVTGAEKVRIGVTPRAGSVEGLLESYELEELLDKCLRGLKLAAPQGQGGDQHH